jgi:pyridoxamine 5'-phosphate oxidase
MDLKNLRINYTKGELYQSSVHSDPLLLFNRWIKESLSDPAVPEPYAMALSTVSKKNKPSCRMVLLKEFNEKGFIFFTSYKSRKGEELTDNPFASLMFFWPAHERQIRIEGKVKKTSRKVSIAYFNSRPEGSRAASIASVQSSPLEDKNLLIANYHSVLKSGITKCPDDWGGYILTPYYYEFWQGGKDRLHDRFFFRKKGRNFEAGRLYP